MITYWDHTEKERSEMTEDEVRKWLDTECMAKGVARVIPPQLVPVPEVQLPEPRTIYRAGHDDSHVFATEAEAQHFLTLKPLQLQTDWQISGSLKIIEPFDLGSITPVKAYDRSVINEHGERLQARKAAIDANTAEQHRYDTEYAKIKGILDHVWDDWHSCRSTARENKRIMDTYAEYTQLAGDSATAWRFLNKTFDPQSVLDAFAWTGTEPPTETKG